MQWARNHIAFLRSFDGTVPFEMVSKGNVKQHVLDFRLVNGKVMVKAKVNGGKTVEFAVDTGAEHTALSEKTARRFNIPYFTETLTAGCRRGGRARAQGGRLRSLEIGTLTVYNLPILIKSPSMRDIPVDQTDGFSPLAIGLSMSIDYKNHTPDPRRAGARRSRRARTAAAPAPPGHGPGRGQRHTRRASSWTPAARRSR